MKQLMNSVCGVCACADGAYEERGQQGDIDKKSGEVSSDSTAEQVTTLQQTVKNLKHELFKLKMKRNKTLSMKQRIDFVVSELKHFLPPACAEFIATQLSCVQRKKKGVRWGENDKATALSLFHSSPKAYRLLKGICVLPSVSTLRRCMKQVSVYPGVTHYVTMC